MTAQLVDQLPDGDPVLLSRVRAGDPDAYAVLFERHRASATAFAGGLAGHSHADDLVAEAFAKVFDALQRDLGPTVSFRSYLLTSIRSIWNNTVRSERRYDLVDDYDVLPPSDALTLVDDPDQRFDNQAVAEAYRTLPERWQAVLWYTAVEGLPHDEVAVHLGIKPNAVAALAFRAREGLRQAYLSAHLRTTADTACQAWAPLLPAHARGSLDRRKRPGMLAHLDGCLPCTLALADLDDVNNRLGALLLPIVLGPGLLGLEGLWGGISLGTSTGATTGIAATGKAGGALLLGKSGIAAAVAASVVGAVVAVPFLVDSLTSYDAGRVAEDPAHHAVDAPTDPFPEPRTHGVSPGPTTPAEGPDAGAAAPTPDGGTDGGTGAGTDVDTGDGTWVRRPDPGPGPSAGPTDSPTSPTSPTTPTPTPTTPGSALSPDAGIGQPTLDQVSFLGQALTSVTFPVTNMRTGSTVTVVVSNLVGFPLSWGNAGWHCPGAVGGLPGDVIRTETTITCTRTGADQATGELVFALLTSGGSEITATVAQVAGVADPVADNDVVTALINP